MAPTNSSRFQSPPPPGGAPDPFDGVLLVDKPSGPTSHDVVDHIRRRFGIRKVGHGGTLDPLATGLLIILLGRGTKLSAQFMGSDKVYEGTMALGVATSSQDADGQILREADYSDVTQEQVEAEMERLKGDSFQTPPMVSAVKVDGVPLYKRARKGQTVERQPRLIHIYEFRVRDFSPPSVSFVVRCTKGTYVRTLCSEIGETLGCGAHLSFLRRTRSGELGLEDATPLDVLMEMDKGELLKKVIPLRSFRVPRRG